MASFIKVQLRVSPRQEHLTPPAPHRTPSWPQSGGELGGGPGFLRPGSPIVTRVRLACQLTCEAGREGKVGRGEERTVVVPSGAASLSCLGGLAGCVPHRYLGP